MGKCYVLYDGRAIHQGTEEAAVLSVAHSLKEAQRDADEMGYECAIYEYDEDHTTQPPTLVNERLVGSSVAIGRARPVARKALRP